MNLIETDLECVDDIELRLRPSYDEKEQWLDVVLYGEEITVVLSSLESWLKEKRAEHSAPPRPPIEFAECTRCGSEPGKCQCD